MDTGEIAKELTVALINKLPMPTVHYSDESDTSKEDIVPTWIGKAYGIILNAVNKAYDEQNAKR